MPSPSASFPRARHSGLAARLVTVTAVVVLLGAACGGDDSKVVADGAASKDTGVPTLAVPTTLPDAAGKECKPATDVKEAKGKPAVEMPEGKPPAELEKTDLKVGEGPEVKVGDSISVHYVGIACSTGKQFDASWDRGTPADFELVEASGLIKGWIEGIPGMKKGGQRRLVIPPDLAYGAEGREGIAPNETLVFVLDLVEIKPPAAAATTVPAGGSTTAPADGSPTTAPPDAGSTTAPGGSATTVPKTTTTG